MADILRVHVLAFAPELTTISDQAWADILTYVNTMSDVAFDGDTWMYRMARIFLAAHIGTVTSRAANGGIVGVIGSVVMEAAGGLRRSYGAATSSTTDSSTLGQTSYGIQYMVLLRSSGAAGPFLV